MKLIFNYVVGSDLSSYFDSIPPCYCFYSPILLLFLFPHIIMFLFPVIIYSPIILFLIPLIIYFIFHELFHNTIDVFLHCHLFTCKYIQLSSHLPVLDFTLVLGWCQSNEAFLLCIVITCFVLIPFVFNIKASGDW